MAEKDKESYVRLFERASRLTPEQRKLVEQRRSDAQEDIQRRVDRNSLAPYELKAEEMMKKQKRAGGGSGGAASDAREMQLGYDLDPKAMMKREGYKKGGKVSSASKRADGIAQRGKTRGMLK